MDVVIFIVDLVKFVGTPTYKYIYSYRKLEKNMNTLSYALQDLNSKKRDLANQLKGELTIYKIEKDEAVIWKERVELMNKDVQLIGEEVRKRSYVSRARLGKRVEEKIVEANELLRRGESFSTLVMDRPPATGMILPVEELVGRARVVDDVWAKLIGGEVGAVGVCGARGIGKTAVVKHVNNRLVRGEDKFGKVIWVDGAQDVLKFQKEIADGLLGYRDKNGDPDPLPEERDRRAGKVTQMLEASEGNVVIILDDVREAFSLADAGVSEPIAQGKCKLVMASPSKEVCKSMGCQVVEVLGPLSREHALALFLKRSELTHLMDVPIIAQMVEEVVVMECGGMPLRVISLASEMKGVNDVRQWRRKRLEQRGKPLEGDGEVKVEIVVEGMPSAFMKKYDRDGDGRLSKDEVKEAFKALGSRFPGWRAHRALSHVDTNKDGFIGDNELDSLIKYVNKWSLSTSI